MPFAITKDEALHYLAVTLPVAAALILRFADLGGESLWLDEVVSIRQSRGGFLEMIALTANDNYPPLHNMTLFLSMRIFGVNEFAARLPSAIFGTLVVPIAYLIGKRLFNWQAGLAAAWLVAFSVFQIKYSQEARMYAPFAFFAALSYLFFVKFLEQPRSRAGWYYAASTALMLYTQYYALFLLAAQNLFVLIDLVMRREERATRLRRWILLQVIVILAFVPWLPSLFRSTAAVQDHFWVDPPTWRGLTNVFFTYADGYAFWVSAIAITALIGLLVFRPADPSVQSRPHGVSAIQPAGGVTMLGLWLLASILIPAALSLYLQPFFIARYTIAASVAWYILVGVGLARIAAGRDWGVAVLVVIVISLTGSSLFAYYRDPDKSDWRTAAPLLHANVLDTDLLLVTPRTARLALQFYYGESDRITNVIGTEYFKAPKVWVLSEAPRPCPKSFNGGRRLDFERQLRALTICRYGALMGG